MSLTKGGSMTIYLIGVIVAFILNCFCFKWHHEYCWHENCLCGSCRFGGAKGHIMAMLIGSIISGLFSWYAAFIICVIRVVHWIAWRDI